jgi:K(+)-stimulated pyrophosphate-energized sodium pump
MAFGQPQFLVTELGLILGIDIGGLLFALALARWLGARDAGGSVLRRLGAALERAASGFLWREFRTIGALALALAALTAAAFGFFAKGPRQLTALESGVWSAIGVLLGAALCSVAAYAAVSLAVRAGTRCAITAQSSLDRALCLAVRAGGAAGLLAETLSALGALSLFGLLYAIKGGFALPADRAIPLALEVAAVLPGFALGGAVAGLFIQRGGGAYHASSDAGGDHAGELEAGLGHDDARNPTRVADLVGDHLGQTGPNSAGLFASASAANVAALAVGAFATAGMTSFVPRPLALVVLPLAVRAFGVIASAVGIMVVRTTEVQSPLTALLRGHLSALTIALAGVGGAAFWLAREHWLAFFGAGALGLSAASAAAHLARFRVERRSGSVREAIDGLRAGAGTTVAAGLGSGMRAVMLPTLLLGVSAWPAWQLGASSGLPSGSALAIVVWLMAILASGPFVLAVGAVGAISDSAVGVAAHAVTDLDAKRRTARLDDAGFSGAAAARSFLILVAGLSAAVSALALPLLGSHGGEAPSLAHPILLWSGAFGAALVLTHAGSVARSAARGTREIALEVERQLRGFPREHGLAQVPVDFTPSYKECVELCSKSALRRAVGDVLPALLAPFVLGLILRGLEQGGANGLAAAGLTSFVVMAAVTGLSMALAIDGSRAVLGKARRQSRPREGTPGFGPAVAGDVFADIFGNSVGPAVRFAALALASGALAIAPLLN